VKSVNVSAVFHPFSSSMSPPDERQGDKERRRGQRDEDPREGSRATAVDQHSRGKRQETEEAGQRRRREDACRGVVELAEDEDADRDQPARRERDDECERKETLADRDLHRSRS
jgi:hypothetical protein